MCISTLWFSLGKTMSQTMNSSCSLHAMSNIHTYTANVYRELQGLYREIWVQEFQIYGDCMYTHNPSNFEIPHSYFHCNICREFDFTGILWGFPALDVGKPCNNLIVGDILQGFPVNFKLITCKLYIFFHCNIYMLT